MKKSFILMLALVFVASLVAGCGKKATERAVEKNLEVAIGGQADVDIKDDKVTIETDQGLWQAGEDIALPADWPKDIHVSEGKIRSANISDLGNSLVIFSSKSIAAIKAEYQKELADNNWNINMTLDLGDGAMLGAEKNNRSLSISIGLEEEEDGNLIIITETTR